MNLYQAGWTVKQIAAKHYTAASSWARRKVTSSMVGNPTLGPQDNPGIPAYTAHTCGIA